MGTNALPINTWANVDPEVAKSRKQANDFSFAFAASQIGLWERSMFGLLWPFAEMWKDKTEDNMKVVRTFLDPIVDDAIRAEREKKRARTTMARRRRSMIWH